MRDYYYILGISENATEQEIKSAYRKLSLKFHPDKNDGDKYFEERFKAILEAYEVLSNSASRNDYNSKLKGFKSNSNTDYENLKRQEEQIKRKYDELFKKRQEELAQKEAELNKKQSQQKQNEEELKRKYREAESNLKKEYDKKADQSINNFESFKKYLEESKKYFVYIALIICLIIVAFLLIDKFSNEEKISAIEPKLVINESGTTKEKVIDYVYDGDGNKYQTIKLGSQLWMVGNLKTTKFSNGDNIINVINSTDWVNTNSPAYSVYNNEPDNIKTFGPLYNWYVINDSRGICPKGFRVPSLNDIDSLISYLKYNHIELSALKSDSLWKTVTKSISVPFTLNLLPGGKRWFRDGKYEFIETGAYFWTSTEKNATNAYFFALAFDSNEIGRLPFNKHDGFSCGCIKN